MLLLVKGNKFSVIDNFIEFVSKRHNFWLCKAILCNLIGHRDAGQHTGCPK